MIAIKGLRQGLLIVFSGPANEPWLTRLRELETKLDANAGFFKGGTVAFDVRDMALSEDDLQRSLALLKAHDVTLWAVVSQDPATQARVRGLGLNDTLAAPKQATPEQLITPETNGNGSAAPDQQQAPATEEKPASAEHIAQKTLAEEAATHAIEGTDGLLARRRVRSGQVLRHPGHIVVIGDVNPGAQLIAGGDIIVWGKLQGSAHAGALGDTRAIICALDMSPSLVKIADAALALRPGELKKRNKTGKAEQAQLTDQQITFTPWDKNA
jgi:septum site-determining protein MinC